jgi:hypothetical protein
MGTMGDVPLEHDGGVEERGVGIEKVWMGEGKEGRRGMGRGWWTLAVSLALARELGRTTPFRGGFADGPVMNRWSETAGLHFEIDVRL